MSIDYYQKKIGVVDSKLQHCFPDFLIISPGKTGTTWLYEKLRSNPQIYIPPCKEIHYFNYYYNYYDINWYLSHFKECDELVKGEICPSYSSLPLYAIKNIAELKPNLKLIFLMREPTERALSHAIHSYRHKEENFFNNFQEKIEDVSTFHWISNLIKVFPHFQGVDYHECLISWLKFFPNKNFFVGFFDSIKNQPAVLLKELCLFLQVDFDVYKSNLDLLNQKVNKGLKFSPNKTLNLILKALVETEIYRDEMQKLAEFLSSEFQVSIPHNWNNKHLEKEQMLTSPKSTIDNYLVLGNKLERQGKLEEAISMYYSALNYDPNFYRYYLQLGKALEQQANSSVISNHQRYSLLDEVIGSYLVADILNPKIPWLKTKLGSLSNNLKALKESLTASPEFLLQITCRASSTQEEIYGPQNLFWGHLMIWHSQSPPEYPEWLEFELPQPQKWKGISIKPQEGNHERSPSTFTIMGSNDKQEWEPLLSISDYKWISDNWQQWNFEGQNEYKYYKMEIWANTGNLQWLTLERLAPIIDNYAVQPI